MVELCSFGSDAGQRELRFGLREPHVQLLGPEWWKAYCHSRYFW
jgi:hypothetical protein